MAQEEVVYSSWPVWAAGYPAEGPNSFNALRETAQGMGCSLKLRFHGTKERQYRASHLTIKGPTCWEVYALCLEQAVTLGFDLSRVWLSSSLSQV